RVIATYGKVSVAREYKLLSRDELPMLEQIGLMNGDRIDLKGAFVDNAKPVYKKKTAEHIVPAQTTVVAVVTAPIVAAPVAPPVATVAKGPAPASAGPVTPAAPAAAPKLEKTAEAAVTKAQ